MRVSLVTRIFAPEPSAASQRLSALCRALVARGDQVTVLTTTPPPRLRPATDGQRGYRVRRAPVLRDRSGYVRGYAPYMSFDIPAFFRLLFSRRPDVVLVEPPPTTGVFMRLSCALRRVPYVYYAADIWSLAAVSTGAPSWVVRIVRGMEAFALKGAAQVLAVTDGVATEVRRLVPRANVTVVGHGVDEQVYNVDEDIEPDLDAVYVGTASEWHGATVFASALDLLGQRGLFPRVEFVGQGTDWVAMAEQVREAGLAETVTFSGPVGEKDAAELLRRSRVALASLKPGIGYDFAVPTKMYSALSVGTPVVFAGPEALGQVVREGALGWATEPTPELVADAIAESLSAPPTAHMRRSVAEWARQNVGSRAVADRAVAAITDAAQGTRRPSR